MSISYTREQREYAKENDLHLVSLSARGVEFQGPVDEEESKRILEFITAMFERRRKWLANRIESARQQAADANNEPADGYSATRDIGGEA